MDTVVDRFGKVLIIPFSVILCLSALVYYIN